MIAMIKESRATRATLRGFLDEERTFDFTQYRNLGGKADILSGPSWIGGLSRREPLPPQIPPYIPPSPTCWLRHRPANEAEGLIGPPGPSGSGPTRLPGPTGAVTKSERNCAL